MKIIIYLTNKTFWFHEFHILTSIYIKNSILFHFKTHVRKRSTQNYYLGVAVKNSISQTSTLKFHLRNSHSKDLSSKSRFPYKKYATKVSSLKFNCNFREDSSHKSGKYKNNSINDAIFSNPPLNLKPARFHHKKSIKKPLIATTIQSSPNKNFSFPAITSQPHRKILQQWKQSQTPSQTHQSLPHFTYENNTRHSSLLTSAIMCNLLPAFEVYALVQ